MVVLRGRERLKRSIDDSAFRVQMTKWRKVSVRRGIPMGVR